MDYINHFGEQSLAYLQFRPVYPKEFYQYLVSLIQTPLLAWDCGTGNGQAAVALADYFDKVIATDINQNQLDNAIKKRNIYYHCWAAENTKIPDTSIDLITIAQALHWFNLEKFYQEAIRVAKPNSVIAAWCYSFGTMNSAIDPIIIKLHDEILGDKYWSKERKYIDEQYQTIPFPFKKISTPPFFIQKKMNFSQLIGYLNTWSAVKEYQKINQKNPIEIIYLDLKNNWGNATAENDMRWPLHLLAGYILKD